jgi:hypothetical protein
MRALMTRPITVSNFMLSIPAFCVLWQAINQIQPSHTSIIQTAYRTNKWVIALYDVIVKAAFAINLEDLSLP